VVARLEPFQFTTALPSKLVPLTVRVKLLPPAIVEVGAIDVVVGAPKMTVKVFSFEVPPPGAGLVTVTGYVPAVVTSLAGITAVS